MARILVVDDQAEGREFLVTLLGYKGHKLLEASDGQEALSNLREHHPDLVIADILMPSMDGFELVCRIRADPSIAATPVIFCSAHYHEREAASLASACGVSHVLPKPCEPEKILAAVDTVLGTAAGEPPAIPEGFVEKHVGLMTDKLSFTTEQLRSVNDRLADLIDICLQLSAERDVHRLLQNVCDAARRLIGARYAILGVMDEDTTGIFERFFTSGMEPQAAGGIVAPAPTKGEIADMIGDRRTFRENRLNGNAAKVGLPPAHPPFHSVLAATIKSTTQSYGVLCLTEKIGFGEFTEDEERLIAILAAQVGRIYENSRMFSELQRRASAIEAEMRERKRLEGVQARLLALLEATPDFVGISDVHGRLTYLNEAGRRLLGISSSTDVSQTHISKAYPESAAWNVLKRGIPLAIRDGIWTGESTVVNAEGKEIPVSQIIIAHKSREGFVEFLSTIMRDISELKRAEDLLHRTHENLLQAGKMEAMGRMAGGLAHDFNNLLTIITGYSDILLSRIEDPAHRQLIEEVQDAGEKASVLTRQLLAFSRKQVMSTTVMDMNENVRNMEKMLRRVLREDITLKIECDASPCMINADPNQIGQIILNLAFNARDAMPRDGTLTIRTEHSNISASSEGAMTDVPPGAYVALRVIDTGCGMDEHIRTHLFEPFFTTKGPGRGTGLGLSTVHGIVHQSAGFIMVESRVGHGSTFSVLFPSVQRHPGAAHTHAGAATDLPSGTETVLLVEDELAVRTLARRILAMQGYKVIEAADGQDGVAVAQAFPGPIHLIVSDIVMPYLRGTDMVQKIREHRPGISVLFMSGYAETLSGAKNMLGDKTQFLPKPFTHHQLALKVREMLDSAAVPAL